MTPSDLTTSLPLALVVIGAFFTLRARWKAVSGPAASAAAVEQAKTAAARAAKLRRRSVATNFLAPPPAPAAPNAPVEPLPDDAALIGGDAPVRPRALRARRWAVDAIVGAEILGPPAAIRPGGTLGPPAAF